MKFTGERFMDEYKYLSIDLEHKHRYNFIKDALKEKVVLDIASGSGYGTKILSETAKYVYGVDVSNEAVEYAREMYVGDNFEYLVGSVAEIPLGDNTVDIIVSYETIEHVEYSLQKQFIEEAKRVLKKDGILIVSTPNKKKYTDDVGYQNEYHLKEFYIEEFSDFLKPHFNTIKMYHQSFQICSTIFNKTNNTHIDANPNVEDGLYVIAICSLGEETIDLDNSLITGIHNKDDKEIINVVEVIDSAYFPTFAKLYIGSDDGYSEENSIFSKYDIDDKNYKVTFDTSDLKNIKELRFDPFEGHYIKIKSLKIKLINYAEEKNINLEELTYNGRVKNNSISFSNTDPMFIFDIKDFNTNQVECSFVLEYIEKNSSNIYLNDTIEKLEKNTQELKEKLFNNDIEIRELSQQNTKFSNVNYDLTKTNEKLKGKNEILTEQLFDKKIELNKNELYTRELLNDINLNNENVDKLKSVISEKDETINTLMAENSHKDNMLNELRYQVQVNQGIIARNNLILLEMQRKKEQNKYILLIPFIFLKNFLKLILGSQSAKEVRNIKKSINKKGYFDVDYYLEQTNDVKVNKYNAFTHYAKHGYKVNLNPNRFLNLEHYYSENVDIKLSGMEPYSHFLNNGIFEGRYPSLDRLNLSKYYGKGFINSIKKVKACYKIFKSDVYDANSYFITYPEIFQRKTYRLGQKLSNIKPLRKILCHPITDYVFYGVYEGKDLVKTFNSRKYLENNRDVLVCGLNPLYHFITIGVKENRIGQFEIESSDRFEIDFVLNREVVFNFVIFVRYISDLEKLKITLDNLSQLKHGKIKIVVVDKDNELPENNLNLTVVKEIKDFLNPETNGYFTILNEGDRLTLNLLSYLDYLLTIADLNLVFGDEVLLRDNGDMLKNVFKDQIASTITYEQLGEACFINIRNFLDVSLELPEYIKYTINFNAKVKYINKVTHYKYFSTQNFVKSQIKPIAFYLPQFHAIPENDEWWGEGFTEWTNTKTGVPMFGGHYQPRNPGELGYYNLAEDDDIIQKQVELAKMHGIHGFCFYYYWFEGKRLLEKPLNRFLEDKSIDFPFCVCWANETWSRRWTGEESEILIKQVHNEKTDQEFIYDVLDILRDERYIRINGKPILLVYRAEMFDDISKTIEVWNDICIKEGIGNIEVVLVQAFEFDDPTEYGSNYAVEFPPHRTKGNVINAGIKDLAKGFDGQVFDYVTTVIKEMHKPVEKYNVFKSAMLGFDNTARKGKSAHIFHGCNGEEYKAWLEGITDHTHRYNKGYEQFIFINAWNEWAEGTYLEPDEKNGRLYLETTKEVLEHFSDDKKVERDDLISIVVPSYNTSKYIIKALDSIVYQTYKNLELIVIDDCSKDNSVEVLKDYFNRSYVKDRFDSLVFIARDKNHGAHYTINEGLELAKGKWLTVLNADDMFEPNRFEDIMKAVELCETEIVFTAYDIIDDRGIKLNNAESDAFYGMQDNIDKFKQLSYSILYHNTAISTGNMVFTRRLYDQIGGFMHYKYIHDWDFILQASLICEPVRVTSTKYLYRLHDTNSFRDLGNVVAEETRQVFNRYIDKLVNNCENEKVIEAEVMNIIELKGFKNLVDMYHEIKEKSNKE